MKNRSCPYSQPLRHKRMGKGVHFMFEVVSRLIFSGEHDPAGRFLKKGAQSAFSGGAPILGSKFVFQYPVAYFGNVGVYLYVFSHDKSIAIIFKNPKWLPCTQKIQNGGQMTLFHQMSI